MGVSVSSPQTCDFQPVFDEFTTNVEMFGNLGRGLTFKHESPESGKRNKSRGAGGIGSLFVGFSVIPGDSSAAFIFSDHF